MRSEIFFSFSLITFVVVVVVCGKSMNSNQNNQQQQQYHNENKKWNDYIHHQWIYDSHITSMKMIMIMMIIINFEWFFSFGNHSFIYWEHWLFVQNLMIHNMFVKFLLLFFFNNDNKKIFWIRNSMILWMNSFRPKCTFHQINQKKTTI